MPSTNLFIADSVNDRIRRVDAETKIITTYAGTGRDGFSGDDGPAIDAQLDRPIALAVDSAGNLFIADLGNHRIRRVDAKTKIITTYAGKGTHGFSGDNGPATAAQLYAPNGLVFDAAGNLIIADLFNHRVRAVRVDK